MTGKTKRIKDYRPARNNANAHTQRGTRALLQSIESDGWIGAMTAAADGELIAGSARIEAVASLFGTEAEPIVVKSDGKRPVIVVREDIPDTDDLRAQRLALADNRVQELDLVWDMDVLVTYAPEAIGDLWSPEELDELGDAWAATQTPAVPPEDFAEFDENIETDYCCPKCGYTWSGKPS